MSGSPFPNAVGAPHMEIDVVFTAKLPPRCCKNHVKIFLINKPAHPKPT